MTVEQLALGIVWLLPVAIIATVIAACYVWWAVRQSPSSPFLDRLVHRDIWLALCAIALLVLVAVSLTDAVLPKRAGLAMLGVVLCFAMWGVISDAITIAQERRTKP